MNNINRNKKPESKGKFQKILLFWVVYFFIVFVSRTFISRSGGKLEFVAMNLGTLLIALVMTAGLLSVFSKKT